MKKRIEVDFNAQTVEGFIRLDVPSAQRSLLETGAQIGDEVFLVDYESEFVVCIPALLVEGRHGELVGAPLDLLKT